MYAGFVTHKHTIKKLGVHQRLDAAAYRMVRGYFSAETFPPIKQILHFEGANGPDDLKFKLPRLDGPNHFYNPETGEGDLPASVKLHYETLVIALAAHDEVKAAFEASWLAHFVVDGLTPAHHHLPEDEYAAVGGEAPVHAKIKGLASGPGALKKNWKIWVDQRIVTTHQTFEIGIAAAMLGRPVKIKLDPIKLARAQKIGYMKFFKEEATESARLDLYSQFRAKGWSSRMAAQVRHQIAPAAVQTVGIIWILAYLEAELKSAKQLAQVTAA